MNRKQHDELVDRVETLQADASERSEYQVVAIERLGNAIISVLDLALEQDSVKADRVGAAVLLELWQ